MKRKQNVTFKFYQLPKDFPPIFPNTKVQNSEHSVVKASRTNSPPNTVISWTKLISREFQQCGLHVAMIKLIRRVFIVNVYYPPDN